MRHDKTTANPRRRRAREAIILSSGGRLLVLQLLVLRRKGLEWWRFIIVFKNVKVGNPEFLIAQSTITINYQEWVLCYHY